MASSIINKIHKVGGDEALKRFFDSKGEDFPPIKLTSREMEFLKGGKFLDWAKRHLRDIIDIVGGISTGNPWMIAGGLAGIIFNP